MIRSLVTQRADVTAFVDDNKLPLLAHAKSAEIATILIRASVDYGIVNKRSPVTGETALHRAIKEKRLEVVKCLVDFGANVSTIKDNAEKTALQIADDVGDQEIARYLKEYIEHVQKADIHCSSWCNREATYKLVEAVRGDLPEAMRSLLMQKDDPMADVNAFVGPQQLPLLAHAKSAEVATILIRASVDYGIVNKRSPVTGETALHRAIKEKRLEVVKCLVDFGANVSTIKDNAEKTALQIADDVGDQGIIGYLKEYIERIQQADIHCSDQYSKEATYRLIEAIRGDLPEINAPFLRSFVRQKADPMILTEKLKELIVAGKGQSVASIDSLLRLRADPNVLVDPVNNKQYSLPGYATTPEIVAVLISARARVNARSPVTGETPLHCAVHEGNFEVVKSLIESYANAEAMDKSGKTPLAMAIAKKQEHPEIAEYIQEHLDQEARDVRWYPFVRQF